MKVCCNAWYSRIFSKWIIPLHVAFIWTVIFASLVPTFIRGEKSFIYDDGFKLCVIELNNLPAWYLLTIATLILSSILLCCVCYFNIFQKVRQSKRRVVATNATRSQLYTKKDVSLFKTMFILFSVFLILTFPQVLNIVFTSANVHVPTELFQWSTYLVLSNSVVNGFVYGITNSQFRNGYKKCVSVLFCRKMYSV